MKKIGIITYHCVPNFGAQLQVLSTIGFLKNHGYEPVVLNWYPIDLEEFYLKRAPKEQNQLQFDFSQTSMPVSGLCRTMDDLCAEIERLNIDGIIIGSDALFDYTPECYRYNFSIRKLKKMPIVITSNHVLPNPFWASYNDYLQNKIPTFGFSISSQNVPFKKFNKKEKTELGRLLGYFKVISTRDEWTKNMVKFLRRDTEVSVTPDPVFAFNQNTDYKVSKDEIIKRYHLPEKYILISFIYPLLSDDFVNTVISKVEKETGAECVSFPMPDKLRRFNTKHIIDLPLSAIDWYNLIKFSSGYIGERMHPIIVSMHNNIPFFCFDQYGAVKTIIPRLWYRFMPESSKIYDILNRTGLIDNMCFYSDLSKITPDEVVTRFLSFNKEKCGALRDSMLSKYESAMTQLLTLI